MSFPTIGLIANSTTHTAFGVDYLWDGVKWIVKGSATANTDLVKKTATADQPIIGGHKLTNDGAIEGASLKATGATAAIELDDGTDTKFVANVDGEVGINRGRSGAAQVGMTMATGKTHGHMVNTSAASQNAYYAKPLPTGDDSAFLLHGYDKANTTTAHIKFDGSGYFKGHLNLGSNRSTYGHIGAIIDYPNLTRNSSTTTLQINAKNAGSGSAVGIFAQLTAPKGLGDTCYLAKNQTTTLASNYEGHNATTRTFRVDSEGSGYFADKLGVGVEIGTAKRRFQVLGVAGDEQCALIDCRNMTNSGAKQAIRISVGSNKFLNALNIYGTATAPVTSLKGDGSAYFKGSVEGLTYKATSPTGNAFVNHNGTIEVTANGTYNHTDPTTQVTIRSLLNSGINAGTVNFLGMMRDSGTGRRTDNVMLDMRAVNTIPKKDNHFLRFSASTALPAGTNTAMMTVDLEGSAYFAGNVGVGRQPSGVFSLAVKHNGSAVSGGAIIGNITGTNLTLGQGAAAIRAEITDTGTSNKAQLNLFSGVVNNAPIFQVTADGTVRTAKATIGALQAVSDPRLKSQFTPPTTTLADFRNIEVGEYTLLDDDTNTPKMGFNAESLRSFSEKCGVLTSEPVPEFHDLYHDDVEVPEEGDFGDEEAPTRIEKQRNTTALHDDHAIKAVDVSGTMAAMTHTIQMLIDEVETLKSEVAKLKKK